MYENLCSVKLLSVAIESSMVFVMQRGESANQIQERKSMLSLIARPLIFTGSVKPEVNGNCVPVVNNLMLKRLDDITHTYQVD